MPAGRVPHHRDQQPEHVRPVGGGRTPSASSSATATCSPSMGEAGYLTPQQVADYSEKLPKFPKVKINERYGGPKGFLLKMVERELSAAGFDESQISGGGLKITTTFDKQAQNAAVESAQKYTKQAADAVDRKAAQPARRDRLGRRQHRRGARPLRRSGLRRELPQLGHHRRARPPRLSRRTPWPPAWRTASA